MTKDFVVKTRNEPPTIFGSFDSYAEAFVLWKEIHKQNPGAVIQDNSK